MFLYSIFPKLALFACWWWRSRLGRYRSFSTAMTIWIILFAASVAVVLFKSFFHMTHCAFSSSYSPPNFKWTTTSITLRSSFPFCKVQSKLRRTIEIPVSPSFLNTLLTIVRRCPATIPITSTSLSFVAIILEMCVPCPFGFPHRFRC